jgi:hypothetical protein
MLIEEMIKSSQPKELDMKKGRGHHHQIEKFKKHHKLTKVIAFSCIGSA